MTVLEFQSILNEWGRRHVPFLFLIDFEMRNPLAWKMDEVPDEILYSVRDFSNIVHYTPSHSEKVGVRSFPIPFLEYESKFNIVQHRIKLGDSYLANLTIKTEIDLRQSLEELFALSSATYKLCWKNKFLVFSPETFVQIKDGKIFSYPMKGTIDDSLPKAEQLILSDQKELSEHVTIVDLIRNDLSAVASAIKVNRFRYISKIQTNQKNLLQVSSEIEGRLPDNYHERIGSILVSLLPAGSISGAPKNKTVEIIQQAEKEKRGFYTGVFGHFDGQNLDSAVMIRFIEQENEKFYFRSGGGITAQSEARKEYQEALDKIYVPIY